MLLKDPAQCHLDVRPLVCVSWTLILSSSLGDFCPCLTELLALFLIDCRTLFITLPSDRSATRLRLPVA